MINISYKNQKGFTLVEVLVSITLFTVVAITGITAVLTAKNAYEKNKALRSTTDSLMFVMEDFSRTARLGNYYHCISENASSINYDSIETPLGNDIGQFTCRGIAFEPFWNPGLGVNEQGDPEGDPEDQLIYFFAVDTNGIGALYTRSTLDQQSQGVISIDNNQNLEQFFQRLTPASIDIDIERSGFDVFYDDGNVDSQPRVIMRVHGELSSRGQTTQLSLQTSVSQRAIRVE